MSTGTPARVPELEDRLEGRAVHHRSGDGPGERTIGTGRLVCLVALLLLLAVPQGLPLSDLPDSTDASASPLPVGAGQNLTVSKAYQVVDEEEWDHVELLENATLIVPKGTTLRAKGLSMRPGCLLEITGGTVLMTGKRGDGHIELGGSCRWFNVTDGATINITGPKGGLSVTNSMGGDARIDLVASEGVVIRDSTIDLVGGNGHSPEEPWSDVIVEGRASAGGRGALILNVTGPAGELVVLSSALTATGGRGGKAPDGELPDRNTPGRGGGFSNGGSVGGYVGAGGSVELHLAAHKVSVSDTEIVLRGGRGGNAGDTPPCVYGDQAGGGAGGYSGGDGATGLSYEDGKPGGRVYDHVGAGGDATMAIFGDSVSLEEDGIALNGGDGGHGGNVTDHNGRCGMGGGGYSGGGGGSYWHADGGKGGDVSGDVGSGGDARSVVSAAEVLDFAMIQLAVTAGEGGDASNGGSAHHDGGAGGGGYSSGGGGGEGGSAGGAPGNDGGNGGTVSGNVGTGGDATTFLASPRTVIRGSSLTSVGGEGGSAGVAGANSERHAGGGGGGYSAGGGGATGNDGQPNGIGGDGGPVHGNVGDGGDAGISIVSSHATIFRNNRLEAKGGPGGNGSASSAPAPLGGSGDGRTTLDGSGSYQIPVSIPLLIGPMDGYHLATLPTFEWTPVAHSTVHGLLAKYVLEVDDDPGFASPEVSRQSVGPAYTPSSLPDGRYHWRVKAVYDGPPEMSGGWSEVWTLVYGPNNQPIVANPLDEVEVPEDSVDYVIGNMNTVFADPDGDALVFDARGSTFISVEINATGHILVNPPPDWVGEEEVWLVAREVLVEDPKEIQHRVTVVVTNVNDPPRISTIEFETKVFEDAMYWVDFDAVDIDPRDTLAWSMETEASFLSLDASTGVLSGSPGNDDVGLTWVTVKVSDLNGGVDFRRFQLEVMNTNDPPMILTEDVVECEPADVYMVDYEALDPDPTGDDLNWSLGTSAPFLSIDPSTGVLSDSDKLKAEGEYWVNVSVSDGKGGVAFSNFTLRIENVDDPPIVVTIPTVNVTEETPRAFDLSPYIEDEDTVRGDLSIIAGVGAVSAVDGLEITLLYTTWVPDHALHLNVTDGTSRVTFDLAVHVVPVNDPPVIVMVGPFGPPFAIECDEDSFPRLAISVEDEDSDRFSYSVDSTWEDVSVLSNGTLVVQARKGAVGTWHANLTVDDGDGGKDTVELSIRVLNVNDPPEIPRSLRPANGTVRQGGASINLSARVFDPDMRHGQSLTVTWTSSITGQIHQLDTDSEDVFFRTDTLVEGTHIITVSVSDGEFERSAWFELTIEEPATTGSFITSSQGIALVSAILIAVSIAVMYALMRRRTDGGNGRENDVRP